MWLCRSVSRPHALCSPGFLCLLFLCFILLHFREFVFSCLKFGSSRDLCCRHNFWDDCWAWTCTRKSFRGFLACAELLLSTLLASASFLPLFSAFFFFSADYYFSGWIPTLPLVSARVAPAAPCCNSCLFLPVAYKV